MVAVAVVDDDAEARACLQQYLQRFAGEQQIDITITAFASAVDLLRHYRPLHHFHLRDQYGAAGYPQLRDGSA